MRSAGKASIPRFAPMPPGVDVAVTASTPPKSFRSRPMWPMASIVGAPCWPLKYMTSEAHDTRLPGACPKISWVIRCVRLSANAYGGFRPRIGDCSFQVNDRSNRRAPLTARPNSSGDGRVWAAAGPAMATVPATLAAAVSHSRRDTVPIRSSLASGFANPAPGGRPTDTRSRYRTQPPTTAHAPSPLAWRAAPRLCCTPGRRGHGADGESDDDRSDPSLLRRPRRGRRSRRAARHGDVPADLRRLPGVFRARLQRTAAHRRDADGVQPALRSARDDHQRDRARESPPPNLVDLSNTDPERDGGLMDWTDRRMLYQSGNQLWHTDSSFKPVPAMASLLSGREVPPVGGETEFASMRHAYRTLPEPTRRGLEGKVVVHSILYSRSTIAKGLFDPEHEKGLPPVRQALVRTNPVNGRKAVYVGSHAWYVEGMPDQESRRLLDELLAHATRPESVYTHRWRPWDLVMWDNRSVLHRGRPWDAARHRRVMRRTTIAGDGPTVDPPFARRTAAWEGIIPDGVGVE